MIDLHPMRQHEVLSYCEAVTNLTFFDTNKGVTTQIYDGHSLNQFLFNPRRFRIDDNVDFFWSELITARFFAELRPATPYWKSSSNTLRSSALICDTFYRQKLLWSPVFHLLSFAPQWFFIVIRQCLTNFLQEIIPFTFRSACNADTSSIMTASSVPKFSTRLANSCLIEYKVSNCNLDDDIVKQTFRFQHLMLLLIITSCSSTTSSIFNPERASNQSQKPILNYTVMPEQECPQSHVNLVLLNSEVVHPSAKICYYG